ncbi:hypothetical protein HAX54_008720, partial [Datura stramonium]|nr:hypothetical protein [Datura stramonium]
SAADDETGIEESNNNVLHRQSSFSCCSEDESNVSSYDLYELASSDNSKEFLRPMENPEPTGAQQLIPRKRRERINERLKIPNEINKAKNRDWCDITRKLKVTISTNDDPCMRPLRQERRSY